MFDSTCVNDETMSPSHKKKKKGKKTQCSIPQKVRSMDKEGIGILNKSWTWFETKSYIPLKIKPCPKFHPLHNELKK